MAKILLSSDISKWFKFNLLELDEFIPVISFDAARFNRLPAVRLLSGQGSTSLSGKISDEKRDQDLFVITMEPGTISLPFVVDSGKPTIDNKGIVKAVLEPETEGIQIVGASQVTVKYRETFTLQLQIAGHQVREVNVSFYASDDADDFNLGEYKDVFCGRIAIETLGSSRVGYRLIQNIENLPEAPLGFQAIPWDTAIPSEIELSQQQANQYKNCRGVCYAVTESRARRAYLDEIGNGVVNLQVSGNNIDHRIAATYGTNDPYMGYGAGGPFALHGYGDTIDDAGVWGGELRAGALLQVWNTADQGNLYSNGGHSVIFVSYRYDDDGEIDGVLYTDYNGGPFRTYLRNEFEGQKTVLGVNLLDQEAP